MNKFRFTIKLFVIATFLLAFASIAQAQATRTWVSGVGDDVNPCSRTAPCKTYAGAISKTANGGEISTLDPGGFGAVTITKNITIEGTKGQGYGSILASSTNGVVINDALSGAPNTVVVTLRNLSINGAGGNVAPFFTGLNGINFVSGKAVYVEDCKIMNFTQNGVRVNTTAAGIVYELYLHNVDIWNSANGVNLTATGAGSVVAATMNEVSIKHANPSTGEGIIFGTNATGEVRNSYIAFADRCIDVTGFGVNIVNTQLARCTTGLNAGGTSVNRITHSAVLNNVTGINFAGGSVRSFGDNVYDGNSNNFVGGAISGQSQQ